MKSFPDISQREYERHRGEIIALTSSKAAVLARDGRVPWSGSRLPPFARQGLAFDREICSALLSEGDHDLTSVLRSIFVVARAADGTRALELSGRAALDASLERAATMIRSEATTSTSADGSRHVHAPFEVARKLGLRVDPIPIVESVEVAGWIRIAHRHVLVPPALEALTRGRGYSGLLSCCSCRTVACESLSIWSVGGLARCVVRVEGARIASVHLMPFMIESLA